jgi:hypothetical protein
MPPFCMSWSLIAKNTFARSSACRQQMWSQPCPACCVIAITLRQFDAYLESCKHPFAVQDLCYPLHSMNSRSKHPAWQAPWPATLSAKQTSDYHLFDYIHSFVYLPL